MLTHHGRGPDKKAAEMSDSDDAAEHPGTTSPAVDRRHQRAWVPRAAALLTALIGLSDIVNVVRPDLAHKLHRLNLVPGTLTSVARATDVLVGCCC